MSGRPHIVPPRGASPDAKRLADSTNRALRELDRRKPVTEPSFFQDESARPPAEHFPGKFIYIGGTTKQPQYSDGSTWQTFLSSAISFATPAITYGTTASAGSGNKTIRHNARLLFPTAVMSAANLATLTLTDDGVDQTLTGSLGNLVIATAANTLTLPYFTGAGGSAPSNISVLTFLANTSIVGATIQQGINGTIQFQDASTHTGIVRGGRFVITDASTASQVFSSFNEYAVEAILSGATISTGGANTWSDRTAFRGSVGGIVGSQAGTHTNTRGLHILGWPVLGTAGTYTNAYAADCVLPTIGGTIRRGYNLSTVTSNVGTDPSNVEGYYCEDITRGTARRANFYAEGATTGTPTDVYGFYQGTAHVVGTNRYGFRATGATTGTPTLCVGFYADGHSVGTTQWAFYADADESRFAGTQMDDNAKHILGTGRDAEIYYDGTDLIIDPDVVGSGEARIAGKGHIIGEAEIDGALNHDGANVGFYATAPATQQTVTGSRGGNAALASLLTALATTGLIVDSTTA